MLSAHHLQAHLSDKLATLGLSWDVEVLDTVDSTSTELMRQTKLDPQVALNPKVLVSLEQTQGRGRRGNSWTSNKEDSLTFSLGLQLQPVSWLGLSLCVGLDLLQSLDPEQNLGLQLKWPNDVWVDKAERFHKLAGILIETQQPQADTRLSPLHARYCVIGIGVNFNAPALLTSTSLASPIGLCDLGSPLSRQDVILQVVSKLSATLKQFETEGFSCFKERFDQVDFLKNRHIILSDGTTGRCLGVNQHGELLVLQNSEIRTIVSMDVSVRPLKTP